MSEWKQLVTSGSDASLNSMTASNSISLVSGIHDMCQILPQISNAGADIIFDGALGGRLYHTSDSNRSIKIQDEAIDGIKIKSNSSHVSLSDNLVLINGTRILTDGKVGIGNASPVTKLHVVHASAPTATPSLGDAPSAAQIGGAGFGTLFTTLDTGKGIIQQGRSDGTAASYPLTINPKGGNVGIGTMTPTEKLEVSGDIKLSGDIHANGNIIGDDNTDITNINQIYCDSIIHDGDTNTLMGFSSDQIDFYAGHTSQPKFQIQLEKVIVNPNSYGYVDFIAKSDTESHMLFVNAGTNRIGIGTSSPGSRLEVKADLSTYSYIAIIDSDNALNTIKALAVQKAGADTMIVYSSGNIYNSNNSYGTLSDIRLKENIISGSSQWNDIKALKFKNYNLKSNPDLVQLGIIAQDLEAAGMSGLIGEHPATDAQIALNSELSGSMVKSVKTSVLHLKAVKALQEAMEKIESLEKRVSDLENF